MRMLIIVGLMVGSIIPSRAGGRCMLIDSVYNLLDGTEVSCIGEVRGGNIKQNSQGHGVVYLDLDALDMFSYKSFQTLIDERWAEDNRVLKFAVVLDDDVLSCFEYDAFMEYWKKNKINPVTQNELPEINIKDYRLVLLTSSYEQGEPYIAGSTSFFEAIKSNDREFITRYISNGGSLNQSWRFNQNARYYAPIQYATLYGMNDLVEEWLLHPDVDIDTPAITNPYFSQSSMLSWAIKHHAQGGIRKILDQRVSEVDERGLQRRLNTFNGTPFYDAINEECFDIAQEMLHHPYLHRSRFGFNSSGVTVLHTLIRGLSWNRDATYNKKIRVLLDELLKTQQGSDDYMHHALRYAVKEGPSWFVKELLEENGRRKIWDINERNEEGDTLIMDVVRKRRSVEFIDMLIAAGAQTDCTNNCDSSLLHIAADSRETPLLQRLLKEPEAVKLINLQSKSGCTALSHAVNMHNVGAVRMLLEAGANPNKGRIDNKSLYDYAYDDGENDFSWSADSRKIFQNLKRHGAQGDCIIM